MRQLRGGVCGCEVHSSAIRGHVVAGRVECGQRDVAYRAVGELIGERLIACGHDHEARCWSGLHDGNGRASSSCGIGIVGDRDGLHAWCLEHDRPELNMTLIAGRNPGIGRSVGRVVTGRYVHGAGVERGARIGAGESLHVNRCAFADRDRCAGGDAKGVAGGGVGGRRRHSDQCGGNREQCCDDGRDMPEPAHKFPR